MFSFKACVVIVDNSNGNVANHKLMGHSLITENFRLNTIYLLPQTAAQFIMRN